MQKSSAASQSSRVRSLRTMLAVWFFAGMPLSIGLSGLFFVAGIPVPPLLDVLFCVVYLSGSLLGVLWSRDNLRRQKPVRSELAGNLLVLAASIGFLLLGIVFAIRAFRSL